MGKIELENKTSTKITATERDELRPWSPIALREAILNAFVHNDYTTEVPPKVEIFDDRIEITSTGGLPNGLSQEEFFEGYSVPRNKEIMRIFKDLGLVEQLGSGVPRILESYKRDCFKFSDNFLRMTLPNAHYKNDQVTDQVTDQVESELTAYQKLVESVVAANLFDVSAPKPTAKQLEKYVDLAQTITEEQFKILNYVTAPKSSKEIQENCLKLKKHTDNFNRHIAPLLENNTLRRTLPNVPKSRLQKYYTTNLGQVVRYIIENNIVK